MTPGGRGAGWRPAGLLVALGGSAFAARTAMRRLGVRPPGGAATWARTNHRGESVSLLQGPSWALGAAAGALLAPGSSPRLRAAAALATFGAAGLGLADDLAGDSASKGLRGHLGALAHGRVTTGTVKVLGLAATGVAAAALTGVPAGPAGRPRPMAAAADALVGGAVVAGCANLANLLDLRPGRALKATLLAALLAGGAAPLSAAAAGASLALLPGDLAERSMLGDTGANAAGALLGTAFVAWHGRRSRLGLLAGLTALTLASERVSFTAVIESTPGLRALDALGRRPRLDPARG